MLVSICPQKWYRNYGWESNSRIRFFQLKKPLSRCHVAGARDVQTLGRCNPLPTQSAGAPGRRALSSYRSRTFLRARNARNEVAPLRYSTRDCCSSTPAQESLPGRRLDWLVPHLRKALPCGGLLGHARSVVGPLLPLTVVLDSTPTLHSSPQWWKCRCDGASRG